MVMLLGNHSSGKSSVVNYITGRDIQQTGVAPTDDGFTMIQRGHVDMDEDGFAATSNKDLFLEDLKPYGSNFLTRFKLKTREMPEDSKVPMNLILLDTPGMIDTPVQVSDRRSVEGQLRGYDFLGVTRWFAQRSDLIVFFFDPSNPGTTGETLDVLSSSLKGMEHKIVLVLHKTDVFDRVTDFGRCYGALCYNLSKVLETKDLPFLYTTGLPTFLERKTTVVPREEILMQMSEVLQLIASAETHKVDTILSNAEIGIRGALLLSKVTEELLNARQHVYMVCGGSLAAVLLAGTLYSPVIGIAIASIMAFLVSPMKEFLRVQETHILQSLDAVAQKHLAGASGTREVWETSLKPTLQRVIKEQLDVGLSGFPVLPSLDRSAKMELRSILAGDIPKLRIDIRQLKLDMKTKLKSSYARKLNEESVPPGSIDG